MSGPAAANSIFGEIFINAVDGVPGRRDSGSGTVGPFQPDFAIDMLVAGGAIPDFPAAINNLARDAEARVGELLDAGASPSDLAALLEINLLVELAEDLEQKILSRVSPAGGAQVSQTVIGELSNTVQTALGNLPASLGRFTDLPIAVTGANAAINTLADTDPYVVLQGAVTNTSATETLDFALGFEEALFEALDPNLFSLSRQLFLEVQLEDTNGDGAVSARSASLGFSAFGTNDPANSSTGTTDPLGVNEFVFDTIRDQNNDGLEEGLRLFEDTAPLDLTQLAGLPDDVLVTHLLGTLDILDLSPGDTANFTAVLSVGDITNPALPLLGAENLAEIFRAGAFLAEFGAPIPEPSTAALLLIYLVTSTSRRRKMAV
ncbi:MAG: PEP-CTERM sorting domain-containing protein [Pseudomonadota bacterium]